MSINELKNEIKRCLASVNESNFHHEYDSLVEIIKSHANRNKELTMNAVVNLLLEIDNEIQMDKYQEDVFLEACSRVEGRSSDAKNIKWDAL